MPDSLFFIVFRNDIPLCQAEDKGGGYPEDILRSMADAGYAFTWNGRPWPPGLPEENIEIKPEPAKLMARRKIKVNRYDGEAEQLCLG